MIEGYPMAGQETIRINAYGLNNSKRDNFEDHFVYFG